jgi:hypothetical protein
VKLLTCWAPRHVGLEEWHMIKMCLQCNFSTRKLSSWPSNTGSLLDITYFNKDVTTRFFSRWNKQETCLQVACKNILIYRSYFYKFIALLSTERLIISRKNIWRDMIPSWERCPIEQGMCIKGYECVLEDCGDFIKAIFTKLLCYWARNMP